ncbi:MAG: hypothetical protein K2N87_05580 [Eubacterium sp.]|nr:hypothetical protein [Eubacterium sp.]
MLRNVVKILTRNLGLKLLAFVFAVTMWMAVVNLDDPVTNKRFTIAVTIENEDVIEEANKYYEIEPDSNNVTFSVVGNRSVLDELSSSDFKAVADMSQLIQKEDENVVPVEIIALRHASQLTISKRTREIKVILEDLMRQAFVIMPIAQGEPADGYALGSVVVEPNRLWVSGPKEVVSQIDAVKAAIDVSNMSTDISDSVVPVLYDEKDEIVDTTRLTLSLEIVTVKVGIVSQKTVPIKVNYSGKPEEGYEVISAAAQPAEVTIKGKSDILNAISSIVIPEDVISVEGANEKFEQKVDLNQYLPSGVSLSKSVEGTVTVKIDIEQLERRVFTVPIRNIGVDDLREGYKIEFNERNVDIEIYGLADDLDSLTVNALRPVLDVSGLAAGRHVRKLQLELDSSKYIVGETAVSFTIISDENNGDEPGEADEPDANAPDDGTPDENEPSGSDNDPAQDDAPGQQDGGQDDDTAADHRSQDGDGDAQDAEDQKEDLEEE